MNDTDRFHVTEAPRKLAGRLCSAASVAACMKWIRSRPGTGRLAIWAAVPPPDDGPDVFLCLPIGVAETSREVAADVVRRWDDAWLLIESAPRGHREDAREALVDLVAEALASASAASFDDGVDVDF